ncbi:MAG: HAD family hydrolase [Thermodesulfobacteriota bacterium]
MAYKGVVVLDRDGTLIEEVNYLKSVEQVILLPGAIKAIKKLNAHGFGVIVVTNQSGVGRGYFSLEDVDEVHRHLQDVLAKNDAFIDEIYCCPHHPDENCSCRKPNTGLLERAAVEWEFAPENCFIIGDKPCDMELGKRFGATTVMVRTGHGKSMEEEGKSFADHTVDNVLEAVNLLLKMKN